MPVMTSTGDTSKEEIMYAENAKAMKNVDIKNVGILYSIDWDKLDDDQKTILSGYEGCLLDQTTVDENNLWDAAEYFTTDEEEVFSVLDKLIKKAPYYLVMAHNCRWNGASGYKLAHNIQEAFYRDYETSICPVAASKGGKVLICNESSHDVPMGSMTSFIALTEREYDHLANRNTSFEEVENFARKYEDTVKGV